jgi:hypothetical protein
MKWGSSGLSWVEGPLRSSVGFGFQGSMHLQRQMRLARDTYPGRLHLEVGD